MTQTAEMQKKNRRLRILTNMMYWQSEDWVNAADSIYPEHGKNDPTPRSPLKEALLLYKKRRHYDVIHTMGIRESMTYGLLCLLTGVAPRQIMTEIFLDEEQPNRWTWRLKTALYQRIAKRSFGIITNSSAEIPTLSQRLKLPENRFRYVPLNSTIPPEQKPLAGEGFILAAGRSLRDYHLFIEAVSGLPIPVVIIGGSDDLLKTYIPPNIKLLRNISRNDYLDYMRRCTLCVLPLMETVRPTGQVVMLEAMAMGKPVISTKNMGTVDYVKNNETGILVPPNNIDAMRTAITSIINHPDTAAQLGCRALDQIHKENADTIHTARRLRALSALTSP